MRLGVDGFSSDGKFERSGWPNLKAALLGLVEVGIVPYLLGGGVILANDAALDDTSSGDLRALIKVGKGQCILLTWGN